METTKFFGLDAKVEALRELRMRAYPAVVAEFDERLDQSWIYHDNALEGVVLSYHELKAAIDKKIISDVTLIPMYEEIKNHKAAIELVRDMARSWATEKHDKKGKRKNPITVDTLKLRPGAPIQHLAFSPDGKQIACWAGGVGSTVNALAVYAAPNRYVPEINCNR